ncbi:outer membrane beta-barrel protein [Formosa sp. 4Alg 33]|uniref:outer membrane beta-barrel protein n=1 Tax=Formosa sp. 4Alg 33 TaxID=3382189 RepID=UPI003D9C493C
MKDTTKRLLILFLLVQIGVYAQSDSKWHVGIEYSIDKLSTDNGQRNDYLVTEGNVNGYAVKLNKTNYSVGVNTQYDIREKLRVSSGLLYANKDFTGTYSCATCDFIGTFPGYSPEHIKQRFLVIPFAVDYSLLSGHFKPILKAGLNHNIEIKNDLKTHSNGYFLEGFVGALITYKLLERSDVGIGYNHQFALSELYKTDTFKFRTNSIYVQVTYKLK